MENQTAVLRVQQDAGFCLDLFFAAAWLFSGKTPANGTKRLANSLQYLDQKLPDPDADMAALFCTCGRKQPFFVQRYIGRIFRYDPVNYVLRDISVTAPQELCRDVQAYWLTPEENCADKVPLLEELPPKIRQSLSALSAKGERLPQMVVAFLHQLQDRLRVVYQTQRKELTEFQLEIEQKPLPWHESGLKQRMVNAADLLAKPTRNWKIALSLLSEKAFYHIAATEEENLLLVGIEAKSDLYAMANRPVVTDRAEQLPALLNALDDPIRLRILDLLSERPYYGGELSRLLGIPAPGLIYHLNLLRAAGFVSKSAEGRKMYYSLNAEQFARLSADLTERFCAVQGQNKQQDQEEK